MLVQDHMSRKVVTIGPQASVDDARKLLRRHRIRQLPVLRNGRLSGIVTDRDLRSTGTRSRKVADIMTAKPFVISPLASVDEAARLLRMYKIGALPVVDGKTLAGIITGSDVLEAFVELSGVAEPSFRVSIVNRRGKNAEPQIRKIAERRRAEIKWLHQGPSQLQLRVKTRRIDDLVTELEGAGFEVASVVASATRR
jgi:acetoin utilization protein AcuB